jgi:hypothetical protein
LPRAALGAVLVDEVDHLARDVDAGGLLDALQAGGGVDLDDHRAVVGAHQVHPGDVQPEDLGRALGGGALLGGELHAGGRAAPVDVGAELARRCGALHGGHHPVADHEGADVAAAGLLDELLDQDVGVELPEGADHRLGGLLGLGQHDAHALGALEQLDHQRCAADQRDQPVDVLGGVREGGDGQPHALGGEQLQGAQLVARAGDALRLVGRVDAHHLELTDHRGAVEGVGRADAGDDRVDAAQLLAAVVDRRAVRGDVDHAAQVVDHADLVAALLGGLTQPARGVQLGVPGQDDQVHGDPETRDEGCARVVARQEAVAGPQVT